MNDSIVVYRSQFERNADQFYSENPEYIFYVILGAVLIIGSWMLVSSFLGRK